VDPAGDQPRPVFTYFILAATRIDKTAARINYRIAAGIDNIAAMRCYHFRFARIVCLALSAVTLFFLMIINHKITSYCPGKIMPGKIFMGCLPSLVLTIMQHPNQV
jgi:hypothetical protein